MGVGYAICLAVCCVFFVHEVFDLFLEIGFLLFCGFDTFFQSRGLPVKTPTLGGEMYLLLEFLDVTRVLFQGLPQLNLKFLDFLNQSDRRNGGSTD